MVTSHCTEKILSVRLRMGSGLAERVGQEGGGWDHPQGDLHMVTARLGCERLMVGRPDCMDRLIKHYSHFVGG